MPRHALHRQLRWCSQSSASHCFPTGSNTVRSLLLRDKICFPASQWQTARPLSIPETEELLRNKTATGPVTPCKEANTPYDKIRTSARGRHSLVAPHKHRPSQERIPCHTCEENALQTAESLWKFIISSKCFQLTSKRNKLQADPKVVHFPPLPNPASSLFSSSLYYLLFFFTSLESNTGAKFLPGRTGRYGSIKRQKAFLKIRASRQWLDSHEYQLWSFPLMRWSLQISFQFVRKV